MQYLDSVTIHNFKSFRHANIKFSKGFNCIVGANGSGKSNLCDSLLFALGETSLRRMRVPNTALLINSFAKPKNDDGVKRAYVKINFAGDHPLEVARIIKSNNKIGYRLNGKKVTRQEVVDVLRAYKSEINDTNIIAQGEISSMVNLNAKERRELIDVAAGIKEFNDKKDAAMKELQKVEEKITSSQIILNERNGFLQQIEKEKVDAEKYLQLTELVKRISYTMLKNSEKQSESDFTMAAEGLMKSEKRKKELTSAIDELNLTIEKLSKDKESMSKALNERSVELSGTNKVLEGINKELAIKETEVKALKEKLEESDNQIIQSNKDMKKFEDEIAQSVKNLELINKELEEKAKHLSTKEVYELDNAGSSQISTISKNQKRIDELYAQEESISKQFLQNRFEIEGIEKSRKNAEQEMNIKSEEHAKLLKHIKTQKERVEELESKLSASTKSVESLSLQVQTHRKSLDENYVESVNIRERLALAGAGSDKANELLKKNLDKGFYGRAYELCSYEGKYDIAINVAANNRLSYFVVESAEIADEAIKLIKARQLGRASFIPLKDLLSSQREDTKKLDKLIDYVKYDKKFEKAFSYIFANTYLVKSIEEAKSIGFGKGRFVTLEGELIEQSGIISGGSSKGMHSPALLESKLKALEQQKSEINGKLNALNSEIEQKRKEIASFQTESMNCNIELKHVLADSESLSNQIKSFKEKAEDLQQKITNSTKNTSDLEAKREKLLQELNQLKDENERIYSLNNSDASKSKTKVDKSELEKLKVLRAEVEQLKIKIATITAEQEMRNKRTSEIDAEIKSKTDENKETRKKLAILDSNIMEFMKKRLDLQQKIGKSDANSQELYKNLQELDSKISKLATERGKHQSDMEKATRDLIEHETRKVQVQTRINDIKAELLSYQNVEMIKSQTANELEAKRAIAKNDIERLGAVNLKAPEVYEEKKRDVEEAKSRLSVLSNEKGSIMSMVDEIESKKLNIFNETLANVGQSFSKLYSYVFDGSARLELDNAKDPFNSGLLIVIKSPKNRNSVIESLSGGEKILVMMMLIFAIQSTDPMAFYVFDEIDISLDKENSKKLSKLMKEISKKSQVIVISHNDSLITATDTAIGVVNRNSESKVVGLQLTPTETIESVAKAN
jgi:chromosome segregation protein